MTKAAFLLLQEIEVECTVFPQISNLMIKLNYGTKVFPHTLYHLHLTTKENSLLVVTPMVIYTA